MDDPDQIAPLRIQQELEAKVRAAQARLAAAPAAGVSTPSPLTAKLTGAGFPARAVASLPRMTGPALEKAREHLPRAMVDGILLLIGPTGRGKTVMATWWGWRRLKAGKSCGRFVTVYQIYARMKQCWTKGEDADAALKAWKEAKFLVIDEVQTRTGSAWEDSVLDELVNARYAAMRPTVLIANVELDGVQALMGARIVDRAREAGGVVNCNWPSYRI